MKTLCKQIEMLRKDDFSLYNHLIVEQQPSLLALKLSASGNLSVVSSRVWSQCRMYGTVNEITTMMMMTMIMKIMCI